MSVVFVFLLIAFMQSLSLIQETASYETTNCTRRCGDVEIKFPFGIEPHCYWNKSFEVSCNSAFRPPKPFLTSINMELLEFPQSSVAIRVNNPVVSSNCSSKTNITRVNLSATPFTYSPEDNRFTAIGCDNYATLSYNDTPIVGCLSLCSQEIVSGGCYGIGCCQTDIPPNLKSFEANIMEFSNNGSRECRSAFVVDRRWIRNRGLNDLRGMEYAPAVLQWGSVIGCCDNSQGIFQCSSGGHCWSQLSQSEFCSCKCPSDSDLLRCLETQICSACRLVSLNGLDRQEGNSNNKCPYGYEEVSPNHCLPEGYLKKKSQKALFVIIGCSSAFGILLALLCLWFLYKIIKRRRAIKLRQKFFKRNGGLLLQQQLFSSKNNIEHTKIFTSMELEKATDNYNVDRILGQGGQGTVYKGMLTDGRLVAIKKSKVVDEGRLEEFINEVVILSQINHRNVVKLLGCCLETEVPLLVYEFVLNGTLFQHLHNPQEEFPITWEMRLRVATEAASSVAYLHSAASAPIYHRDIKSTNILLDDKYRAKVSDFGSSRSIDVDQTHLTTRVLGTFGYLDPEYFQSSQFTEKSDVYSFGVVLVELLTGQKPLSATRSMEGRSLSAYFLDSMDENCLFNILDARVLKEAGREEIMAVAKLARKCLNLNGKKRPNMRTVTMELERIRSAQAASAVINEHCEEFEYDDGDTTGPWAATSTTGSGSNNTTSTF